MFSFLFSLMFTLIVLCLIFVIFGAFGIAIMFAVGVVGFHDTHDPTYLVPAVLGFILTVTVMSQ